MSADVRFGRYRGGRRLGSGAFATVWLAYDDVLHAPVAVKLLADNWAHHLDVRERFLEEARILRRADSDRVVRVHDIGEVDDGRPYFVMTYADRGSLADLAAAGPVPPAAAAYYVAEAARGVAVLHRLGVVHRDLTPSNVLLRSAGSDERVLVADLGLAKALARASGLTVVAGTPGYAAPEQSAGDGVDERSDVYALGALAWRLVTGRPPPAVAPGGPALVPLDEAPAALAAAVARAVDPDPTRRWPSAQALAAALDPVAVRPKPAALRPAADPIQTEAAVQPGTEAVRPGTAVQPAAVRSEPGTEAVRPTAVPADLGSVAAPVADAGREPPTLLLDPIAAATAAPSADADQDSDEPADRDGDELTAWARSSAAERQRLRARLRRGRRLRRRVLTATVVLLAAAAGVAGWWRFAAPVTVRDNTGTVTVTVPAGWSGAARGDTWPLDRYGLPGRAGVGVTVTPDLSGWSDTRSDVPGIFVGASKHLPEVPASRFDEAARHPQCRRQERSQYAGERLAGPVVRWSDCAGGPVTFSEAVLTPRAGGGYLVVVQIKQAGDRDRTTALLDSIRVAGTP